MSRRLWPSGRPSLPWLFWWSSLSSDRWFPGCLSGWLAGGFGRRSASSAPCLPLWAGLSSPNTAAVWQQRSPEASARPAARAGQRPRWSTSSRGVTNRRRAAHETLVRQGMLGNPARHQQCEEKGENRTILKHLARHPISRLRTADSILCFQHHSLQAIRMCQSKR